MFGLDAPAPSGPPSSELMHRAAASRWFRFKVNAWSWIRGFRGFQWDAF